MTLVVLLCIDSQWKLESVTLFQITAPCKGVSNLLLISKENVRSGLILTIAGVGIPTSRCAVLALNSFAKSIAFTPLAPRAGPTGG